MCGIVGVANSKNFQDHNWLNIACKSLSHRGPDYIGEWWSEDQRVGMGHSRLSILDLSSLGRQPMHLVNKGLSIIFNGEIYNYLELRQQLQSLGYTFNTQSDTEVLLASYAEWGSNCLKYLNGMFAFALYDSIQGKLFIARDRTGEKPLFYRLDSGTLFFASELKALLVNQSLPKKIDLDSLDSYLYFGFIPGNSCIFSGYQKLPPAHALFFDIKSGILKVWRYWETPVFEEATNNIDELSLINELESILDDAVKKQLVADVPVGVLLSGGLDSSLITALATRHSDRIKTFSVTFPGYEYLDETFHSRKIASYFKTKHTEIKISSSINTIDLMPKLVSCFDEPMADSSMLPTYLLSQEVKKYCTVALGGDGGDEIFGGYNHYQRLLRMQKFLRYVPNFACSFLAYVSQNFLPTGFKGRNYFRNSNLDLNYDIPFFGIFFDQNERNKLIGRNVKYSDKAESLRSARIPKTKDLLSRAMLMDFENYLSEDILVKVDRSSMAHSLEIRSPFLDYRLIEFAFKKVPPFLKVTTDNKKILLKKLASRILPDNFNSNRKQGFSIPLQIWLKKNNSVRDHFFDVLTNSDSFFDKRTITALFKEQDKGRNNSERLFALFQFELWRKRHNAHL
jgi:asparagine synthase (glutamine-hydrolysing)